ncbi:hypothetical protein C8A01DRAFT_31071 [Parachaetomium inaequale]|uniref:Uncharacterized protein n=1 Tax=Parachaetomium inaequale TaxID=2588326 RepID=A0AAN6SWJ2_9PEZI|nr:hypothetical protein C8A01DRAFT_31071 [Parachaetomium inaequale]
MAAQPAVGREAISVEPVLPASGFLWPSGVAEATPTPSSSTLPAPAPTAPSWGEGASYKAAQGGLYADAGIPEVYVIWTSFPERRFACRDRGCSDYGTEYRVLKRHLNTVKHQKIERDPNFQPNTYAAEEGTQVPTNTHATLPTNTVAPSLPANTIAPRLDIDVKMTKPLAPPTPPSTPQRPLRKLTPQGRQRVRCFPAGVIKPVRWKLPPVARVVFGL